MQNRDPSMAISGDDSERLSVYVKVARVLRERIRRGDWAIGQMLPSLSELCEHFAVSRNSMRQALQNLEDENLIGQARGRHAVVLAQPRTAEDLPKLILAINDPASAPTSIEILGSATVARPPSQLEIQGQLFSSYQHIRKLHRLDDTPYVLSDFFVAKPIFDTFDGAEQRIKIDQLLRKQDKSRLEQKRQLISVSFADEELSRMLNCSMGETVVSVRRWWCGSGGRILCAARSTYLGKFFVFESSERIDPPPRGRKSEGIAAGEPKET